MAGLARTTAAHARTRLRGAVAAAAVLAAGAAPAASLDVEVIGADGRPMAEAVVWIESDAARAAARPLAGVEVTQRNKAFAPSVVVVTVGTAVAFPNRDTVRHHVYSYSPTKRFEIKLYIGTPAAPVVFDRTGVAVLGCNIHDDMAGWVVVVDSPWFARAGADGRVTLPDVPAGRHVLRAWHPDFAVGAPAAGQAIEMRGAAQRVALRAAG